MIKKIAKKLIIFSLGSIAGSPVATRFFFNLLSFFKNFPDGNYKYHILAHLANVRWPEVRLAAQEVVIGGNTSIRLIPHVNKK